MIRSVLLAVVAAVAACGPGVKGGGPTMNNRMGGQNELPKPVSPVVSSDILERDPVANKVEVKHILIGWKDTGRDGKPTDQRAMERPKAEAETIVKTIVGQYRAKAATFEALMKQHSEDPGSGPSASSYAIAHDDVNYDSDFRLLAIRLNVDEVGVTESQFGFHIIKRIQ